MNQAPLLPSPAPITPEQFSRAQTVAAEEHRSAVDVLEQQLALPPYEFISTLADALAYPSLTMRELETLTPAYDIISFKESLKRKCLAFRNTEGKLLAVFGDPFDGKLQDWAMHAIRLPFTWVLAYGRDIDAYLMQQEESFRAMDSLLPASDNAVTAQQASDDLSIVAISESTSPVVRLVHSTLYDALKMEASDIHLESNPTGLAIKYRIDGVLSTVGSMQGVELAEQVISRVKVMSELDIAERRIPQDGRFKISIRGREIDIRVSIMPSIFGEDAVLRILDKQALSDQIKGLRLDYLGFDADSITGLRRLATEPYGMLLVTGPTGSGKTTTLYAVISEINRGQDKIVTIEDPVEYQLPGVLQIPVNEKKGLTFARGLRSILRHDPDTIMVGEIRDTETAQIAVQSALTGHLVFTTVHANNVFDVIDRFLHMGVTASSFVSALNGIVAQRLVRLNCPHCSHEYHPEESLLSASGLTPEAAGTFTFRAGTGCGQCRGTGFKGRKAIAELLYLNDELREAIATGEPVRRIKETARRHGTRLLRESALELVRCGETTLQEINRVTFVA